MEIIKAHLDKKVFKEKLPYYVLPFRRYYLKVFVQEFMNVSLKKLFILVINI